MELNHSTLCNLLRPISFKWKKLGTALSLTPDNFETIASCRTDDECLDAVLMRWSQPGNQQLQPYSWEALVLALRSNEVDNTHLADEITRKINTTSTQL